MLWSLKIANRFYETGDTTAFAIRLNLILLLLLPLKNNSFKFCNVVKFYDQLNLMTKTSIVLFV